MQSYCYHSHLAFLQCVHQDLSRETQLMKDVFTGLNHRCPPAVTTFVIGAFQLVNPKLNLETRNCLSLVTSVTCQTQKEHKKTNCIDHTRYREHVNKVKKGRTLGWLSWQMVISMRLLFPIDLKTSLPFIEKVKKKSSLKTNGENVSNCFQTFYITEQFVFVVLTFTAWKGMVPLPVGPM